MDTISEINVKGMVCDRCISTVKEIFSAAGYPVKDVILGQVVLAHPVEISNKHKIKDLLSSAGFELLSNKKEELLSDIKLAIDEWIGLSVHGNRGKLSDHLTQKFNRNYDSLGEFFSQSEGKTIERFFIEKRLEKVKELLVYTDLSLSEIAFETGFSSPHHLSSQFKRSTGINPSELRIIRKKKLEVQREQLTK